MCGVVEQQRYLMQYGYLPMSDMEMGNLRTDQELTDAVRRLQMFGHIPVTGVVDDVTRELMKRPRCSLPDILPDEDTNRVRRYIKQGSTWDKTRLTWSCHNCSLSVRPLLDNYNFIDRNETFRSLRTWHLSCRCGVAGRCPRCLAATCSISPAAATWSENPVRCHLQLISIQSSSRIKCIKIIITTSIIVYIP
ncbi:Peptidoglycan binding-like [Trinorchestia longiramus]|nr:Peptidoglycan binding-like [Trinorchestia longiramus]